MFYAIWVAGILAAIAISVAVTGKIDAKGGFDIK